MEQLALLDVSRPHTEVGGMAPGQTRVTPAHQKNCNKASSAYAHVDRNLKYYLRLIKITF